MELSERCPKKPSTTREASKDPKKLRPARCAHRRHAVSKGQICATVTSGRKKASSHGDRFIPARRSPSQWKQNFLLSKSVDSLGAYERRMFDRGAEVDPFGSKSPNRAQYIESLTRDRPEVQIDDGNQLFRSELPGSSSMSTTTEGFWTVGGTSAAQSVAVIGVSNGRGGLLGSGTNAPLFVSRLGDEHNYDEEREKHQGRLAFALDVQRVGAIFQFSDGPERSATYNYRSSRSNSPQPYTKLPISFPNQSRQILDAPDLRDDFYCSILAYSPSSHCLAIGLRHRVYVWSETKKVRHLVPPVPNSSYVTCMSFSSDEGQNSILAVARADGQVSLWSLHDNQARFDIQQPSYAACVSWKPQLTQHHVESGPSKGGIALVEELLVGDGLGDIYCYVIDWPNEEQRAKGCWHGSTTLLAKVSAHTQQICGITWSPEGDFFATGGNDNVCYLFETEDVLGKPAREADFGETTSNGEEISRSESTVRHRIAPGAGNSRIISMGREKQKWMHNAAVKAIAFCPWQRGLLATGGGSNDRCIHFYHINSGACLATISVAAQVTSLIWSKTRREIAATFGYAQPNHSYRIAVFSWPDCNQVAAISWPGGMRALCAIPYPGGPSTSKGTRGGKEGGTWLTRTAEEGCIVVAGSDDSIKFHEVWCGNTKSTKGKHGLGGSPILESLEGYDQDGEETIR